MENNVFFYSNMVKLSGIISMPDNTTEEEKVFAVY